MIRVDLQDAGQLSARLDLQVFDGASDGQGGTSGGFETVAALWARIEPVAFHAEERAGEAVFTVTHRIWLRFRGDVTAGMRFVKDARVFVVRAVIDPDETRRFLLCRCTEERR